MQSGFVVAVEQSVHALRSHDNVDDCLVDRPTQLICISDLYLCQQTNTKDIAGQSASMAAWQHSRKLDWIIFSIAG